MKKLLTLCIIHQHPKVLLGLKKRGFGARRWNGFGGKLEEGESIERAAKREVLEETGLIVSSIEKVGVINFEFQDGSETAEVHIFSCTDFQGGITETDEMKPAWFDINELPLDNMWPADTFWLPILLAGKKFRGKFLYNRPSTADYLSTIIEKNIQEVDKL